jgi:predicted nucleic acid-binding protein
LSAPITLKQRPADRRVRKKGTGHCPLYFSKFSRNREAISRVAVYLSELGKNVETKKRVSILKDEPDNRVLECTISGKADAIVTGDKEILSLKEHLGIKIITHQQYLEKI